MKTSIACIGSGFVGGSLQTVFAERDLNVYAFDKAGKRGIGVNPRQFLSITHLIEVCERDTTFSGIVFLCLPTPMIVDTGECDLSIVEGALKEISRIAQKDTVVVCKSTMPPGSTVNFNRMLAGTKVSVIQSPEFLKEATALDDMRNQDRIVLGGEPHATRRARFLFSQAFPNVPIVECDSTTSEMVKYVANCYLAVKVSYANEVFQICEKLGLEYNKVIEIATLDKRLGSSHWQVPGPMLSDDTGKPAMGYGGSCLIKDINALIRRAKSVGVLPTMMLASVKKNMEVRPQKDWKKLEGRAVSKRQPIHISVVNTARAYVARTAKPLMNKLVGA